MNEVSKVKEELDGNEGSAARTRPTSVAEIMLRRKRKASLENVKEKTVEAGAQLLGNDLVGASVYHDSEKGYDRSKKISQEEHVKASSRKKEDAISISREEKQMKEDPGGAAQLLDNNLVEKVPDYQLTEREHDGSKKVKCEKLVKDIPRKIEDVIPSLREANSIKEDPVRPAHDDHAEKASDYHASEKGHDRSKRVRHEERVRDSSRKKEEAISSSRKEKPMKEDPARAAQSLGNYLVEKVSDYHASEIGYERSEKLSREERVKDSSRKKEEASSRKKEEASSSSRELKSMKDDVGAAHLLSKDVVEKVSYHASQKGHDRSKKVRHEERESSRKKDVLSSSKEEIPMKEDHMGTAQSLGNDLIEKVSDYHQSEKGFDRSGKLRREERVKDSSRKKEEPISSSREERQYKPRKEEPAAERKREAKGERSTAEKKSVEEHKDRRRMKEETNSSCREERLDKEIKKEDLAANRKVRVEGECPTTEITTMTDRDRRVLDTKLKVKRESHAAKTTEKQIHPQDGREKAKRAFENLPGSSKRLRSLVVADIPRDDDSLKTDNGNKRNNQNGDHKKHSERNMSKRHDPGKVHSVEVSERWGKTEQPKSYQHDKREKRRRSRSQEHVQDRQKRSSPFTRVEKATSRHKRDHEERLEIAGKDKSGKHQLIDNENKVSSSVNNKSRRYSSSKSELGGYSPRKRREEASAKAASPPNLSSEKKSAKWDLAPTVTAGISLGPVFPGPQAPTQTAHPTITEASLTLLKPFMEVPFRTPPARQTISVDSVQLTESTRRMRRLYVENVPDSASEKSLIDCFNGYMLSSGSIHIQGSQPCISCIINKEKQQALVEFLTPQDASAALSLNGFSFAGSNLNIRRPKDYVETTSGELEKKEPATNALGDNVEDSSNKIFIGGFPKAISSQMLMEIVSVFGPLKAFRYVSKNDLSQQCAFLEYTDGSVTPKACAGLNGMKLGGSVITAVCSHPDASSIAVNEDPPFYGIPQHAKPLLGKPKHILKLKNVVVPEDLPSLSEPEVKDILEDVRLECARFGVIKSINIVEHQKKDVAGSETNTLVDLELTDSKETNMSVIPEEDEGSKKADDIADNVGPVEFVRPDNSTGEDKLCEPCSDTAVETKTQANEDHHSPERIVGESAKDEAENPQEEAGSVRAVKTRWDTGDKIEEEQETKDVLEPGCILIEYRRPEAARDAAHSLHGRLYENRIVKAGYVSKELYQTRFPSG